MMDIIKRCVADWNVCYNEPFRASSPPISLELQKHSHRVNSIQHHYLYRYRFRSII